VNHTLLLCEVRAEARERFNIDHMLQQTGGLPPPRTYLHDVYKKSCFLACLGLCEVQTEAKETFEHITTLWQSEYYGNHSYDGHFAAN
jgi:hypothetical protein